MIFNVDLLALGTPVISANTFKLASGEKAPTATVAFEVKATLSGQ
ncbi:hypothetical protein ACPOL_3734 [Acidisarcina polymorpha]|uniref:Uncharacterized protein n=1 Tax=Acidisarcina polymorpha TaxID=2211140 RepID=A0A2Z5G1F5_9BACT|nr:hypothetical protein ACPOL_3734 [Acidisarcina polymorpha]